MKATKKLIFATISLVAAASLTVGSTFAWFSYRSDVELGAVEFAVDSGDENLQVAVVAHDETNPVVPDNSAFSYSLTADTIKPLINGGNVAYQPLTVEEDATEGSEKIVVSQTNKITLLNDGDNAAPNGSYAVFDLIFRYTPATTITKENMPFLVLNQGSQITPGNISVTTSDRTYAWDNFEAKVYGVALTKNAPIDARASNAARVAFLIKDDSSTSGYINKIWAPNEDHRLPETDTGDKPAGYYSNNLASDFFHHYESKAEVKTPKYEGRVYSAGTASLKYSKIAQFPEPEVPGSKSELRLTVKVWMEHKDGDCIPSFLNDSFKFLLKFKTSSLPTA